MAFFNAFASGHHDDAWQRSVLTSAMMNTKRHGVGEPLFFLITVTCAVDYAGNTAA